MRLPCSLAMISTRSCCHRPTQLQGRGGGSAGGGHPVCNVALASSPQPISVCIWCWIAAGLGPGGGKENRRPRLHHAECRGGAAVCSCRLCLRCFQHPCRRPAARAAPIPSTFENQQSVCPSPSRSPGCQRPRSPPICGAQVDANSWRAHPRRTGCLMGPRLVVREPTRMFAVVIQSERKERD